jgi:hypothetical protein
MFIYRKTWNISVSVLGKGITNNYIGRKEIETEEGKCVKVLNSIAYQEKT